MSGTSETASSCETNEEVGSAAARFILEGEAETLIAARLIYDLRPNADKKAPWTIPSMDIDRRPPAPAVSASRETLAYDAAARGLRLLADACAPRPSFPPNTASASPYTLNVRPHVGGSPAQITAIHRRRAAEAKYLCRHCENVYTRRSNLREHEQRHENRLLYPCHKDGCVVRFNTKGDLRSHDRKLHSRRRMQAVESA
ncbi:hypothetical protein BD626DRAFT_575682 [Schizophyllum amplum]|uniref:C2H2-type domain-containing protein n=1 Tax=Schizophyllum amplum TaxID=97359 RepID=A0A550BV75_9AGAR|nr:hypothetical protein BD626DRAFT_575682 [Auriculariopsis ampla]